jgi:hypothetical protein
LPSQKTPTVAENTFQLNPKTPPATATRAENTFPSSSCEKHWLRLHDQKTRNPCQ